MKRWNNFFLVALICVNIVLIAGIILETTGMPKAYGQVRANDYILVPGSVQMGQQIVWIIDLKTHQITSCRFNANRNMIEFGQVTDVNIPVAGM